MIDEIPAVTELIKTFGARMREIHQEIKDMQHALATSDTPEEAVEKIECVRLMRSIQDDSPAS